MLTKEQVLGALPKLKREDLEAVHLMAGHLLAAAQPSRAITVTRGGTLAACIHDALMNALGAAMYTPFLASGATTAFQRNFNKEVPGMIAFLDADFKGWNDNKLVQLAFLRSLFDLLIYDLKEMGVTPSPGIVVRNMKRIPQVFDSSFPDYRVSRMGHLIVDRFRS